jgi:hypothetical protein
LKKNTVAIIIMAVTIMVVVGVLLAITPSLFNNTSKNTSHANNSTITNKTTNNTTLNSSTVSHQTENNPPPRDITQNEAKELAKKYVGSDVILGKPVMTTYKRIHVWQVPVYTRRHEFISNIYIDVRTGEKVD